ncbi:MAG: trigger factor [Acidobacteriota bacterium]|nr:trigger factor [Acidobacteriota bacterium]MDE3031252.1 trigger factor [Acidobacteriota bacterium]MDE3092900.1 trigger factor [Acidobacteriota bacterium]MDE3146579.1 trigger factor [Acidobacteriota bacterium]
MRATSSALENNRIKLTVEVDEAEMAVALDAAAKTLAQQVNVKGFRKGKVPKQVLIANIGGAAVLRSEAIRESLPDFYARAVSETLIDPIGQPDVTITGGEDEGVLVFEAEVEVRPDVTIVGYDALRVTIPSPVVGDDEIEAQIDRFRETDAVLHDVDRPIVNGDLVNMDIRAEQPDSDAEPLEMSDFMYTVGSGSIAPEVDELILGLRAGEELVVNTSAGTGQSVVYTMRLKQVKERILPELTDEWVEENTEWPTVDEMRDAVLAQMSKMKVVEAQMSQRDATLIALGELVSDELVPEVLVDAEANDRVHDLGHRLAEQKMDFEQFLQATGQTPDQLLAAVRADAQRAVKIDLALRALVKAEGLEATEEEVEEELVKTAEAMSLTAQALRDNLYKSGRVKSFDAEVAKIKANRWLGENATFVDHLGIVIDRELLREDQSVEIDE